MKSRKRSHSSEKVVVAHDCSDRLSKRFERSCNKLLIGTKDMQDYAGI